MSFLFNIEGRAVFPNAETLLISPFKEIWERDESPNKENAIEDFAYIEFMTSMLKSNPFREYTEDRKEEVIIENIITQENWKPDELVKAAMDKVIEFQEEGSITYQYWMAAKQAAEKTIKFFMTFSLLERDDKGKPIYKPREITTAIGDTEKVLQSLDSLKKKVDEEVFDKTRNRGNKEISPFAKPDSL